MNWSEIKEPIFNMCFTGVVVAPWSLMQDMTGSSPLIELLEQMTN